MNEATHDSLPAPHLPVLLVHGMHSRDKNLYHSDLWGRIPTFLRESGTPVWFGNEDAWGDVEQNAIEIAASLSLILERSGADKVHLIAHSKGGLDAHRAVHMPDVASHVASVVTLGAPLHGMRISNILAAERLILPHVVAPIFDRHAAKMGDEFPDSLGLLRATTTKAAEQFMRDNPDVPGIEYRSYAFVPHHKGIHKRDLRGPLIRLTDGPNDGIAPLWSTEDTNWIVIHAQEGAEFNHDDSCDLNKRDIPLTMPDGTVYPSILYFMRDMVRSLDEIAARKASVEAGA